MSESQKVHTIRKRAAIPPEHMWNLEDIYSSRDLWEQDFMTVLDILPRIQAFSGMLTTAGTIRQCFELGDRLGYLLEKLYVYAHLKHHQDTTDPQDQSPVARIVRLSVDVLEAMSFIDPELLALPEEQLLNFINTPELSFYKFTLEGKLRQKPHTLPKDQEAIVAKAGMMAQAPQTIFSMLNDADLKFPSIKDEQGNDVELTHARYSRFLESRERRVRKDAFEAMYSSYRKQQNTIASVFNAQVQKNIFYSRVLHYPSCLEMALFADNIPIDVYTNLIETVRRGLPAFHRYLAGRKKALKLSELHPYDLTVPIVRDFDWKIPYGEAVALVTDALKPMGAEYLGIVKKAWSNRWIDIYENEGKHSGAYSWGVYRIHPYILLNHENRLDDVFTIAHEMGHAVHSYLADMHQEFRYAGYTIFIAEIASTLNEALLTRHLLDTSADPKRRAYLLTHLADNYRATLFVQTMFAEFEKTVHGLAEQGVPLTLEKLNEVYLSLHCLYYGDGVVPDKDVEIGWMRIPHFYQSFYVYKYATGFSAAQSFARQISLNGSAAVGRYLELLKSGGKDYPLNLLRSAGLDMSKPGPITEALAEFENVVSQLEALT